MEVQRKAVSPSLRTVRCFLKPHAHVRFERLSLALVDCIHQSSQTWFLRILLTKFKSSLANIAYMIINWVEHVRNVVRYEQESFEKQSDFVHCNVPTLPPQNDEPKAIIKQVIYEEERTKEELKALAHSKAQSLEKPYLMDFWYAKLHRPVTHNSGRRHIKGQAKGVGQVLKKSHILSLNPEKLYPAFK